MSPRLSNALWSARIWRLDILSQGAASMAPTPVLMPKNPRSAIAAAAWQTEIGERVLEPRHTTWLREFCHRHGRRPTVLHIGNIANNAYVLAKGLNAAGLDCDVLCYGYYHIMSCPEWEEVEFAGHIRDQLFPAWEDVDLGGFHRPAWFAQGPLDSCLRYLLARRTANRHCEQRWQDLERDCRAACETARTGSKPSRFARSCLLPLRASRWLLRKAARCCVDHPSMFSTRIRALQRFYKAAFSDRQDCAGTGRFCECRAAFLALAISVGAL